MSRQRGPDREFIEAHGGVVSDTPDGYAVTYTRREAPAFTAKDIEAAIARAREYGTTVAPVWRPRGTGYYVATSHAEHPGWVYLVHIDEDKGQPLSCECIAGQAGLVCHHAAACLIKWREQSGWVANDEAILAAWEETLRLVRQRMPSRLEEEAW